MMKVFNKLVRDNIPEIIEKNGEKAYIRILDDVEYKNQLDIKLQEEVNEYLQDDNIEELADIVEVIYAILDSKNVKLEEFERVRKEKAITRGAFSKKIFLEKTI